MSNLKKEKKRSTNVANRQEVRQDTGLHILQVVILVLKFEAMILTDVVPFEVFVSFHML